MVNIFNINGDFRVQNNTIMLTGAANDTFIFNVSGAVGLSLIDVKMILAGGLVASDVVFNVSNSSANIAILNSTLDGTFYTSSTDPSNGTISVQDLSTVTGALVAGGGGDINVSNSIVNAEPFVVNAPVVAAPEMPTIMTAGFAALLLVARSYFGRRN
jgi:hypothetical protein